MGEGEIKKAILAVDDNPEHLELLAVNLTEAGYRLIVVNSGAEALKTIEMEKPGLVLLDMLMPEMNGLEVLKRIKAIYPDIPVAMVTSVWDDEEGKKCLEAGAFDYITKPIDFDHLKNVILIKLFTEE
jgi:CheY-like chemotaxis protein